MEELNVFVESPILFLQSSKSSFRSSPNFENENVHLLIIFFLSFQLLKSCIFPLIVSRLLPMMLSEGCVVARWNNLFKRTAGYVMVEERLYL